MRLRRIISDVGPALIIGISSIPIAGQGIINLPATLVAAGVKVESVKTGLAYCEGPAVDASGNLFFSEGASPQHKLWKVTPQGTATVARQGDYFNGNEFDPQGRLVSCGNNVITRMSASGTVDTISKSGDNGFQLLMTNDLSIATNGAMFFTNHNSGKSVFYRSPTGALQRWTGFPTPNGVEWVEEKGFLYLCLSDSSRVDIFTVASDGSITYKKKFVDVAVPDGITLDEQYNVYIASNQEGAIHVYDSTGKTLGTILMQGTTTTTGNASNCVFGGTSNKTLYITGNGGAYKVQFLVAGRTKGGANASIVPPSVRKLTYSNTFACRAPRLNHAIPELPGAAAYDLRGRRACRIPGLRHGVSAAAGAYIVTPLAY
jgi:gluconolactonase